MTSQDVVLKELPVVRVAALTGVARSYETPDISAVIQPLYPELFRRLDEAGVALAGSGLAWYEPAGEGEAVVVHAAVQVAADLSETGDFAVVDLPPVPTAATIIHHGQMDEVERSMQTLASWIEANGWRADGYARELYVDYCADDPAQGVTELQLPVVAA